MTFVIEARFLLFDHKGHLKRAHSAAKKPLPVPAKRKLPAKKLPAGANRRTCQSLLSKASESDAYRQLVAPIDARAGGLHPRDERSRHLDSGWSRPMGAPRPRQRFCASCGIYIEDELADLHSNNQVNAVRKASKASPHFLK